MNDKSPEGTPAQITDSATPALAPTPAPAPAPQPAPPSPPSSPSPPPPSPPWFGGVILACLGIAAVWTLTYTLSPLPGQRTLGGWNYAIIGLLLTMFIRLSMQWRGDPPDRAAPNASGAGKREPSPER